MSISGKEVGYIQSKEAFEESIKEDITNSTDKNIDYFDIKITPEYELKLVNKELKTNEQEISKLLEENVDITYKYYEIALNNNTIECVNTIEEAEELVNKVKEENKEELDLSIVEKYTNEEQEWYNSLPSINGIKLAVTPITGTITSRYGVSSSIRSSDHTGLDIAAKSGTPIKVVADGTVTCASYKGSYGNIVKIDHGNGFETWYAHTSKMYVSVGQQVKTGDVIAAVGSTGNSTGPHLHFEIRIDGEHVNPQKYLYRGDVP